MKEQTEVQKSYLTFRLGDELFAANVSKVHEILEIPRITKIPKSPDFMRGVINLRGNVLPVIDSRVKFGLPQQDDNVNTCIIVLSIELEGQEISVGMIADSVQEVMELDDESILASPNIGSRYKSQFIQGMVKSGEQFVILLDINTIFTSNDVSMLQELTAPVTDNN